MFDLLEAVVRGHDDRRTVTPAAGNGNTHGEDKASGAQAKAGDKSDKPVNNDTPDKKSLREQAMADAGVQALLEVFPAEIRDVEEM